MFYHLFTNLLSSTRSYCWLRLQHYSSLVEVVLGVCVLACHIESCRGLEMHLVWLRIGTRWRVPGVVRTGTVPVELTE